MVQISETLEEYHIKESDVAKPWQMVTFVNNHKPRREICLQDDIGVLKTRLGG